jgi:hypothetical protein
MSDNTSRLEERLTALVGPPPSEPGPATVDLFFLTPEDREHLDILCANS